MNKLISQSLTATFLAVLPAIAWAQAPDAAAIEAQCNATFNMPAEICSCMGEKAVTDLNDNERSFLLVMMQEDQAAADAMRAQMAPAEIINSATFLRTAPGDCAQ